MTIRSRSFLAAGLWLSGLGLLTGCALVEERSGPAMPGTSPGPGASALERQSTTTTLGQPATSSGMPEVTGSRGRGRPEVEYQGPGTGTLAPGGTPTVTGSRGRGRPEIEYVPSGQTPR